MANGHDLERTEELFAFLRGRVPNGLRLRHVPKLSADDAWSIVYVLQEYFRDWSPPDSIERCDVCGDLYDSDASGTCLDFGDEPYHFCDDCERGSEYEQKIRDAAAILCTRGHHEKRVREQMTHFADDFEKNQDGLTQLQWGARLRLLIGEFWPERPG